MISMQQGNSIEGTGVGSLSVPFTSSNTAGNLIIAFVRMSTTWQTVTVTDTAGNIYTDAASQVQAIDGHQIHLFYAKNIAGGPNTVTAAFSSTNNHPWFAVFEYSGLHTVNPFDQAAHAQGTSASPNSGFITGTSQFELVFEATGLPATYTGTVKWAGMTPPFQDTGTSRAATVFISQSGRSAAEFSLSSSTNWTALVVAFKQ